MTMHLGGEKWAEVQSALHRCRTCECGEPAARDILYKGHEHPWILVSECVSAAGGRGDRSPGTNALQCQGMTAVCQKPSLRAREKKDRPSLLNNTLRANSTVTAAAAAKSLQLCPTL